MIESKGMKSLVRQTVLPFPGKPVSKSEHINTEGYLINFRLLIVIFEVLLLCSCRVTFLPAYDAGISEQIDQVSKAVDKLYLSMLETTASENGGRTFEKFAAQYVDIEVEMNSLLNKNKIRPLNENSTRICEITLQLWIKYKQEHKKTIH